MSVVSERQSDHLLSVRPPACVYQSYRTSLCAPKWPFFTGQIVYPCTANRGEHRPTYSSALPLPKNRSLWEKNIKLSARK